MEDIDFSSQAVGNANNNNSNDNNNNNSRTEETPQTAPVAKKGTRSLYLVGLNANSIIDCNVANYNWGY
jgi:hypothetical protein